MDLAEHLKETVVELAAQLANVKHYETSKIRNYTLFVKDSYLGPEIAN